MKYKSEIMLIISLAAVFMLSACIKPQSPAQAVYQLQGQYAAAVVLETGYDKLPDCKHPTKPVVCSDFEMKKAIRKFDDLAWDAITAAQTAVRTPGFKEDSIIKAQASAQAAVNAFTSIVATLKGNE